MKPVRIITPTGHLGTTPLEKASFERGCAASPDFIVADSGSADIGPYPLGADKPASDEVWQRHDIEAMLLAARRSGSLSSSGRPRTPAPTAGSPSTCGWSGRSPPSTGSPFRLAAIYSETPVEDIRRRLKDGATIRGLNGRPDGDAAALDRTDRIVAVMGAEPIRDVLEAGADVVIAGRSSDCAIFAAPLLNAGHSMADAFFCGKAMECASFCGEPFMGKETILGRVDGTGVYLTAMHPDQRCTPASVVSHAMYERLNPFREYVPGGYLDMTHCRYEQVDEKTTRVTGQTFVPSPTMWIKLEGSGKVAERALFIAGIRDPYTIANLDRAIGWAKGKLTERFGPIGERYDVFYTRLRPQRRHGSDGADAVAGAPRGRHRGGGHLRRRRPRRDHLPHRREKPLLCPTARREGRSNTRRCSTSRSRDGRTVARALGSPSTLQGVERA